MSDIVSDRRAHWRVRKNCPHDEHDVDWVTTRLANGQLRVWRACSSCGENVGDKHWYSAAECPIPLGQLDILVDRRGGQPPCERCGDPASEVHHWAPRGLFGSDADAWPTGHLCSPCHREWHRTITGADAPSS